MRFYLSTLIFMSLVCGGQAEFAADWDHWDGVTTFADVNTDATYDFQDIVGLSHYYDGSDYHYFRMTLEGGVASTFATDYMLNIDSVNDAGQDSSSSLYVAEGLSGIDQIIDEHSGTGELFTTSGIEGSHNHYSAPGANIYNFTIVGLDTYDAGLVDIQGASSYIEWKIDKSLLPSTEFDVYGSTVLVGATTTTYDITAKMDVIPEPATVAMLGLTGFGCLLIRRIFS